MVCTETYIISLRLGKVNSMGMAGLIIGTIGAAFLQGRAAREQAEAQARQYEAQAKMQQAEAENAAQNAEWANKDAQEQARVATENTEMRRRQLLQKEGEQRARIGASNITATGSALNALADTRWDIDYDTMTQLYNNMQGAYSTFGKATDFSNESNKYDYYARQNQANAEGARAAGKRAEMNAWLGGAFSLASNLSGFGGGGDSGMTGASGSGLENGGNATWTNWNYKTGSSYKNYGKINTSFKY